jgi:hypothetical protein
MNQRSIVLYLARKRLTAIAIHEDPVATLGAAAIRYPLITRYFREPKLATSNPEVVFSEPINEHNNCDQATLPALDE